MDRKTHLTKTNMGEDVFARSCSFDFDHSRETVMAILNILA